MSIERLNNPKLITGEKVQARSVSFFWIGMILVILAAVLLRLQLLDSFPMTADEGIHLVWLRLLSAGYEPYSEVYITYPPLYPLAIKAVWDVWPTEAAQRWFSVAYTIFGVVGVALLARHLVGALTGVIATILLLFSPTLFEFSRAVLGEFPSVAWSVWAIWLAWLYKDSLHRRYIWLIGSALCLAFSLLTKFLSPFLLPFVPLVVAARWLSIEPVREDEPSHQQDQPNGYSLTWGRYNINVTRPKALLSDMLLWSVTLLLTIALFIAVFDVGSFFTQVVGQRLEARQAYTEADGIWQPRYNRAAEFVADDAALITLGLLGFGLAWQRRQKDMGLLSIWLILALLMLSIHSPLRYKHFVVLLPHLALFGGSAIAYWLENLKAWGRSAQPGQKKRTPHARYVALAGGVVLLALYLWHIPAAITLWQSKAQAPQPPLDEQEALAFIREITAPDDCLITDDMPLLHWSGRMAPPELAEVSSNRLKSGALTTAELIEISDAYDCQVVAAVSNRIPKFLPDYMEWVKRKYIGLFRYGEDDLFLAKIDTDPNPTFPLWADFDGRIIFHGYDLTTEPVAPGEAVSLTLIWQAQINPAQDYAIFVQLRNDQNVTVASADHQPYKGFVSTSKWPAGAVIQEVSWLTLPPDLPPGSYNLYVGLYDPDTLERLPLLADTSGENALILGPLTVQ